MTSSASLPPVLLKVDHRETKLKPLFDQAKIPCVYENLQYGDFQLLYNNQVYFIIERKTISDLLASIKDGRYKNQKARLFQVFKPSQVYYVIEGAVPYDVSATSVQDKTVVSCVINTMLRDKVGCFNTKGMRETFDLVQNIYSRFVEDPKKYCEASVADCKEETRVHTSALDDAQRVLIKLLCQIPGMSDTSTQPFVERWQSFAAMYEEMRALNAVERLALLNTFKVNNRKLSRRIVENLVKLLFDQVLEQPREVAKA